MKLVRIALEFTFLTSCLFGHCQTILPPILPWTGISEKLIQTPGSKWSTPFENKGLNYSPDYTETMNWLDSLSKQTKYFSFETIGYSAQGRPIKMIIATNSDNKTPENIKYSNKPTILAQAGIHAGEIDGKDAGMMLLRDIAVGDKRYLLDSINFLFIPILNVDGHERSSSFSRVNQRGPEKMGWRTNAKNLNLNRDYTKVETEEIRAVLQVINAYDPDLYLDIHVTDGANYQYDITYGFIGVHGYSPNISTWLSNTYRPFVDLQMSESGHIPGPLLFAANDRDFTEGNSDITFGPKYSHAYGDVRHLPTVLIENHSLKPFRQRVLGTYIFLEQTILAVAKNKTSLFESIQKDRLIRPDSIPLKFEFSGTPIDTLRFKAIQSESKISLNSNGNYVSWSGIPILQNVPVFSMNMPITFAKTPKAYWLPPQETEVLEKLALHGIITKKTVEEHTVDVVRFHVDEFALASQPSEGRVMISRSKVSEVPQKYTYPIGSVKIPMDQDKSALVTILMDPNSPDGFFQWGYFDSVLSRTEYIEGYVMEPLIEKMLLESDALKEEFETKKKENAAFARNQQAIYRWFYEKSPYYDKEYRMLPFGAEY